MKRKLIQLLIALMGALGVFLWASFLVKDYHEGKYFLTFLDMWMVLMMTYLTGDVVMTLFAKQTPPSKSEG